MEDRSQGRIDPNTQPGDKFEKMETNGEPKVNKDDNHQSWTQTKEERERERKGQRGASKARRQMKGDNGTLRHSDKRPRENTVLGDR